MTRIDGIVVGSLTVDSHAPQSKLSVDWAEGGEELLRNFERLGDMCVRTIADGAVIDIKPEDNERATDMDVDERVCALFEQWQATLHASTKTSDEEKCAAACRMPQSAPETLATDHGPQPTASPVSPKLRPPPSLPCPPLPRRNALEARQSARAEEMRLAWTRNGDANDTTAAAEVLRLVRPEDDGDEERVDAETFYDADFAILTAGSPAAVDAAAAAARQWAAGEGLGPAAVEAASEAARAAAADGSLAEKSAAAGQAAGTAAQRVHDIAAGKLALPPPTLASRELGFSAADSKRALQTWRQRKRASTAAARSRAPAPQPKRRRRLLKAEPRPAAPDDSASDDDMVLFPATEVGRMQQRLERKERKQNDAEALLEASAFQALAPPMRASAADGAVGMQSTALSTVATASFADAAPSVRAACDAILTAAARANAEELGVDPVVEVAVGADEMDGVFESGATDAPTAPSHEEAMLIEVGATMEEVEEGELVELTGPHGDAGSLVPPVQTLSLVGSVGSVGGGGGDSSSVADLDSGSSAAARLLGDALEIAHAARPEHQLFDLDGDQLVAVPAEAHSLLVADDETGLWEGDVEPPSALWDETAVVTAEQRRIARAQRSAKLLGGRLGPGAHQSRPLAQPRVHDWLWVRWDYDGGDTRTCRCRVTRVDPANLKDDPRDGDKKIFVQYDDGDEPHTHVWRVGKLYEFVAGRGVGARLDVSGAPPEVSGMCDLSDDEWESCDDLMRVEGDGALSDAEETAAEHAHEEHMQRHVDAQTTRAPRERLSDYEEQRLVNIRSNEWVLAALFAS